MTEKTVHRLFWAWQFAEEAQWLDDMAAEGWTLQGVGFCSYRFEACAPGQYQNAMLLLSHAPWGAGFRAEAEQAAQEYGAEWVGRYLRWAYFRRPAGPRGFEMPQGRLAQLQHLGRVQQLVWCSFFLLLLAGCNLLSLLRFSDAWGTVAGLGPLVLFLAAWMGWGLYSLHRQRRNVERGTTPGDTRIVHRWIWVWNYEEEDRWLNGMAQRGWVLDGLGFCTFHFRRCEPGEYTVRLQLAESIGDREYIDFVESTGAEYVGRMVKWIYFRKKTADGPFELFSDVASLIAQTDRILWMLGVVGGANLLVGLGNLSLGLLGGSPANAQMSVINLGGAALLAYAGWRVWRKRGALKQAGALHE